jgi:alkanesulfonate monooxygenase SsuD/methylene tetrahydromethanopterin reductase-like flavin-dependent oxidoreductase (luciferase family)
MRIGMFDQLPCADWQSEQQRYEDILAQIALADALGFDTAWLGELHFSRSFSILADPLMVVAAAAQRTTRIRLGTAVTLLPLHNPIKIAEQAAVADVLSNGRLEFGVGRGTAPIHHTGYNVPLEESRERFEEALEVITQAWSHERFSYSGKFYSARDISVVPRPVQQPHPPIRLAANSPDSFANAGLRGWPIFATPVINPPDKLLGYLQSYRDALPPSVKGDRAIAFSVHVAASRAQARLECERSLLHFFQTAAERLRPLGEGDVKGFEAFQQAVARMQRMRFEDIDQEIGVFGDPGYCVERIRELQRAFDIDEFICYFNQGGIMDPALVRQSMRLFAEEVMPRCR